MSFGTATCWRVYERETVCGNGVRTSNVKSIMNKTNVEIIKDLHDSLSKNVLQNSTWASVNILLRIHDEKLEILFMKRASNDKDPYDKAF